ncbi:MAG: OmpA family protein [Kofleriaceae bacterium]|nr:OmpA family protein [Kofleriaceae bacterium]
MNKLALSLLFVATTAHADRRIEVGVAIGGHAFSKNDELGVADQAMEPGPVSSGLLGARAALSVTRRLALEGELSWIPTEDDVLGDEATVWRLAAHPRFDLLTGRFKPFVVAGIGAHILRSTSPQMANDADKAVHWGGGVRYALRDTLELRLDARHLIVPGRTTNGATSEFEMTAGVTFVFGTRKPKPAPPPVIEVVEEPPPAPPPPPPVVEPPKPVIEELAGIGFERDSAVIDLYSAPLLERAYQLLADHPKLSIEIAGHTSSEGNADRNLSLSIARANAVKQYLVKRGIDPERIVTVGHGSEQPIADNTTDEGRRENRRIEFRVLTPD